MNVTTTALHNRGEKSGKFVNQFYRLWIFWSVVVNVEQKGTQSAGPFSPAAHFRTLLLCIIVFLSCF